jgi:predicted Na+-dependent transporter
MQEQQTLGPTFIITIISIFVVVLAPTILGCVCEQLKPQKAIDVMRKAYRELELASVDRSLERAERNFSTEAFSSVV